MSAPNTHTFYVNVSGFGWRRSWLFALPLAVMVLLLWPHYSLALALALVLPLLVGASMAIGMVICTIAVGDTGLVIYRVTALPWGGVNAVSRRLYLGLPYLYIERTDGARGVWLPLYLRNESSFYATLLAKAPPGNALRSYAESVHAAEGA